MIAVYQLASLLIAGSAPPATLEDQISAGDWWEFVSVEQAAAGTNQKAVYGSGGIDILMFHGGDMCAVVTKPSPPLPDNGIRADCGKYDVNEAERTIIFNVVTDGSPKDIGDIRKRYVTVDGDILMLRTMKPKSDELDYTLKLKRYVKPADAKK